MRELPDHRIEAVRFNKPGAIEGCRQHSAKSIPEKRVIVYDQEFQRRHDREGVSLMAAHLIFQSNTRAARISWQRLRTAQ